MPWDSNQGPSARVRQEEEEICKSVFKDTFQEIRKSQNVDFHGRVHQVDRR